MISPNPPILVIEWAADVSVCTSVEEAALSLEPWWVEQNRGAVYDAEGRRLALSVDKYNVRISLGDDVPADPSELRSILLSFLNAVGERIDNDINLSLPDLINLCVENSNRHQR